MVFQGEFPKEIEEVGNKVLEKIATITSALDSWSIEKFEENQQSEIKKIEEYFNKLEKVIRERKEALLSKFSKECKNQKVKIEVQHEKLRNFISLTYGTIDSAIEMCKSSSIVAQSILNAVVQSVEQDASFTLNESNTKVHLAPLFINSAGTLGYVYNITRKTMEEDKPRDIVMVAGSKSTGFHNGAYNEAKFYNMDGIVLNPNDNCLYISDCKNHSIRMIDSQEVSTFVGKKEDPGLQNSQGINAQFNEPCQIVYYQRENSLLVADSLNNVIRKVTMEGNVSTLAGSARKKTGDGIGAKASFNYPLGIAINEITSDIYVSELHGHVIRRISPEGQVTTIAGCGKCGFADGQGRNAMFNSPYSLCFSHFHNSLFVCDYGNHRIRIIDLKTGNVSSIGSGKEGSKDGIAEEAQFRGPIGISSSKADGSLFVCDFDDHKIRKITFDGAKANVKTIVDQPGSNSNTTLKCDMQFPRAIYFDNNTNICYFTTSTRVYKFYKLL